MFSLADATFATHRALSSPARGSRARFIRNSEAFIDARGHRPTGDVIVTNFSDSYTLRKGGTHAHATLVHARSPRLVSIAARYMVLLCFVQ